MNKKSKSINFAAIDHYWHVLVTIHYDELLQPKFFILIQTIHAVTSNFLKSN